MKLDDVDQRTRQIINEAEQTIRRVKKFLRANPIKRRGKPRSKPKKL